MTKLAKGATEIISKIGIETLGSRGVIFKTGDIVKHHPIPKFNVVDSTGDCFVAAFLLFLVEK